MNCRVLSLYANARAADVRVYVVSIETYGGDAMGGYDCVEIRDCGAERRYQDSCRYE